MNRNENSARIVAALMTDGHLQLDKRRGVISFYSKSIEDINFFNELFCAEFGVYGRVFTDLRQGNKRYKLFLARKLIAVKLNEAGVPAGNKTKIKYGIPTWITTGSTSMKTAYLTTIFDCEGSIYHQADGRWRLTYTMYKDIKLKEDAILFLNQVRKLLAEFGICTNQIVSSSGNHRKDGTISVALRFEIKKQSFNDFYNSVGFRLTPKREKLFEALKISSKAI